MAARMAQSRGHAPPIAIAAAKAACRRKQRASARRADTVVMAASSSEGTHDASRRDVLKAPGMAAVLAATSEWLWLPGTAHAAITTTNVTTFDTAFADLKIGPIGGAVGCKDYAQFEPVIYGVIEAIKKGEGPPFFNNASRAFLLKEAGDGNRVMLTLLTPEADHKGGLAFFINQGPKANPLWEAANDTWRDASVPITATASTAVLVRGPERADKSFKGLYFGQYNLGWNGKVEDWIPLFTSPEATDFHNSVGVEFSVAHTMDLKDPGNTYKTKAKNGIEVFHAFNSLEGAQELAKAFAPDSPFFASEKRYVGPYEQIIWEVVDDITFA